MRILVTGSRGFIGTHLTNYFKREHEIFHLLRPSVKDSLIDWSHCFIYKDNNIRELAEFLRLNQIDGIIHLASLYIQKHKPEDIPDMLQSNLLLGTAILEATSMSNVSWFINAGTIWQNFNAPDYSDDYCPVNLYAATKQAFMDIARFYVETTKLRFCTLKLCDTYGPGDTRRKIFSLFEEVAKTGATLEMSPGRQKMDILHIDDVVEGFAHLAQMMQEGADLKDEYVLTSGKQLSLRQLAIKFEKEHHVHLNIVWGALPYREREVMNPYRGNVLPEWKAKHS